MPQVDLETLVCGNDRKIAACDNSPPPKPPPEFISIPSDFPAESYYVSKDDEFDWYDRNAFFERKGSLKGNSNSMSKRHVLKNLKSRASILGLPKPQKANYLDGKPRRKCRPTDVAKFFPKRSRSSGKSIVPLSEPTSPKVSCIGRVRSKRDRSRRRMKKLHLKKAAAAETATVKATEIAPPSAGLWRRVKTALKIGRRKNHSVAVEKEVVPVEKGLPKMRVSSTTCISGELPGLGGLTRFSSGRRAESWGGCEVDLEMDAFDSPDTDKESSVWSRRGVGPGMEVGIGRDWECVGPASV